MSQSYLLISWEEYMFLQQKLPQHFPGEKIILFPSWFLWNERSIFHVTQLTSVFESCRNHSATTQLLPSYCVYFVNICSFVQLTLGNRFNFLMKFRKTFTCCFFWKTMFILNCEVFFFLNRPVRKFSLTTFLSPVRYSGTECNPENQYG